MHPKSHVIPDNRYADRRKKLDTLIVPENRLVHTAQTIKSPCGEYRLEICQYSTGPNTWNVSRGIVIRNQDVQFIADVKRNYGHFWYAWVQHANRNVYLLCGEDYQGYSVINLTTGKSTVYFPDAGYKGAGFYWAAAYPSPDSLILAVHGCYWACPYEVVFFDFRNPEQLPLPEVDRIDGLDDCEGWLDNATFVLTREIECRKSDGASYESLTPEEQDALDNDSSLSSYRIEKLDYKRKPFAKKDA